MKSIFLWLALIGAVLFGLAAYLQGTSMDLSRFDVSEYLAAGAAIPEWCHVVALPFLVGLIYFVTAVVCLRLHPTRGMTFAVLVGCLLLSASLCLFNFGIGLFASVTLVPLLVAAFTRPTSSQN